MLQPLVRTLRDDRPVTPRRVTGWALSWGPPLLAGLVYFAAYYPGFTNHDSLSMWLNYPIDKIISNMNNPAHYLGGRQQNAISILSTWSAHAASWATEEAFPVHVMMYEDMLADTEKALEECIDFLGWKKDKRRIKRAVKAASMKALQETEEAAGFTENVSTGQERFFHAGGTRWQDELGPKWIKQIEDDHREVMIQLGYLEKKPVELTAVS